MILVVNGIGKGVSHITASNLGAVCKRQESYAPLTKWLLYNGSRDTKQMRFGRQHKDDTRAECETRLKVNHMQLLLTDPSSDIELGHVEIKCPFRAQDTPLINLSTDKSNNFFLKHSEGQSPPNTRPNTHLKASVV